MIASGLIYFLLLLSTVIFLLYLYSKELYRYWKKLNVPQLTPKFPFGDLQNGGFAKNIGVLFKELGQEFPDDKFFGVYVFLKPLLIVKDPELIKTIFVKDFLAFHDRGVYYNEKDDPLSAHLFAIEGLKWKNIRTKLTPTFTSGKMKMMFPIVVNCAQDLKEVLKEPAQKGETFEAKEMMSRLMTDIIALCAFGIEINSLRNPNALFRKMGKKTVEPNLRNFFIFMMQISSPALSRLLRLRVLPKDVSTFFLNAVKDVMDQREKQKIMRNDFMQLLIELMNKARIDDPDNKISQNNNVEVGETLTFEEAAAEALVFFLAGFETSSATVQFALFELAKNLQIQQKLRDEIQDAFENEKLTYEKVHNIPYLDRVIDETLRKYPVVPTLFRECNKNYKIPDTNVVIPKGTNIHIPIYGIQMDPKYFPEPEKFEPDRFTEVEKQKRHHYTYLPFGEGPRNCIGKRFGLMQVRVALIILLQNYQFHLPDNFNGSVTFDPKSFTLLPKGGMHLKITSL